MYELKIYRGVLCHDNEEWYKIWRGIDLSVQNWHKKFDKFWPEHSKIPKIYTLIGCFWQKYVMFELKKSIEELCLMALKLVQNLKETGLCFLKIFVYWLKNSDFILLSKMAEFTESRTYWFTLKIASMFPILTSRNRLMNTFIIVNITLTCSKQT